MHVVVINAQLVVGRAGEEATGFEAISERLDGLSREASEQIQGINREAEAIARLAVRLFQAEGAHVRFGEAQRRAEAAGEAHNLDRALETHNRRLHEVRQQALAALARFEKHLDGLEGFLESANHLAINARVEAAKTSEYRGQFESVADRIQHSVAEIRAVVEQVREDVSDLQAMRQERAA
jgi:methyl-accepting chemotaxis protein